MEQEWISLGSAKPLWPVSTQTPSKPAPNPLPSRSWTGLARALHRPCTESGPALLNVQSLAFAGKTMLKSPRKEILLIPPGLTTASNQQVTFSNPADDGQPERSF